MSDALCSDSKDSIRDEVSGFKNSKGRLLNIDDIVPLKEDHRTFEDVLKHISTEVVEAAIEYSIDSIEFYYIDGKPYGLASELADIFILTVLASKRVNIDLIEAVEQKMAYLRGLKNGS